MSNSFARNLLDVTINHFQPPAMGSGSSDQLKKKRDVAIALQEKIPHEELVELQRTSADRLVRATVIFFLWAKGFPKTDYTRVVKDLDSMLEVLFDALKSEPPGIGIMASDSFICEIIASKTIVEKEEEEGIRVKLDAYDDEKSLQILQQYQVMKAKPRTTAEKGQNLYK